MTGHERALSGLVVWLALSAGCAHVAPTTPVTAVSGLPDWVLVVPPPDAARAFSDVAERPLQHPFKAGPCVRFSGLEEFVRLRLKLDGCLTGCRLAKDRAAEALTKVMTREALDYPT